MRLILLSIVLCLLNNASLANELIRSIEYTVSSDQSLNEARHKAMNQLKAEVLAEYGTLVQSEVTSIISDKDSIQAVNYSEITGGYIQAKIKEELFDGTVLYLLASLRIDIPSVKEMLSISYKKQISSARITELLKQKEAHEKELTKLNKSNQLLKMQLKVLKGKIDFASKSLDENLNTEKQIKEKSALLREAIDARTQSDIEKAWKAYKLLGEIYVEGMTESDMNSLLIGDFKAKDITTLNTPF